MSIDRFKLIILTIILFMGVGGVRADGGTNKILVISSYSPDYQWSNSIIDGIKSQVTERIPQAELNVEFLSSERFGDPQTWVNRIDLIFENYTTELPSAIVLISDEAWMAYRDARNERFKDVPLLLCAVKPHSITIEKYVTNIQSLKLSDFTATQEVMKQYNSYGVLRAISVPNSVLLIDDLIPQLDKYVVITDNRLYGVYARLLVEEYLNKTSSQIPVQYLDGRYMKTDSMLKEMANITPQTGVLLTSWLTGEAGYEYSKQYLYRTMSALSKAPIFITNDIGLNTGYFLGGYFYEAQFWGDRIGIDLAKVLRNEPHDSIQIETFQSNICQINWQALNRFNLLTNNLPGDTMYMYRPESILEKYATQFAFIAILLFIVTMSYVYMFRNNVKMKKVQKIKNQAIEEAITANKHLVETQDNLKVALLKAEAADRLKSAFISNMDHEIRTPLNSIVGFSNLITSMDNKEDMEEAAKQIADSSEKLLQLIKGIVDLSQLESGTSELNYEKVSLNGVFDDLLNLSKTKVSHDVSIRFCPPNKPLTMVTEPHRLSQVLYNLTDNAIKFTRQGEIELGYFAYDDNWVEFYVKDTGVGIEAEEINKIFEHFYKHDSYVFGVGLGLSVAKQIIKVLGGQFGVTSTPGVGSRFWFRIRKKSQNKEL